MSKFLFTQEQNIELIVEDGEPLGGAVIATHVWMHALHELGNEIVLFRDKEDCRPKLESFDWIQDYKVFSSQKGIPVFRWVYYRFPKIFFCLKTVKPDYLIESIPSWSSLFIGFFCKILKIKQVLRLANDNMLDERITQGKFKKFFIFWGLSICEFILVQNEYQYDTLRNKYPKKKILKISNPFVLDKQYLKIKSQPKGYIAWVANFRFQKNLQLLYKVASNISDEKFFVAGQPLHPLDPETDEYYEKLKMLNNVVFVGSVPREKILDFFEASKFLLNTSRHEGFTNTFLEAMGTGTPILTTQDVNPDNIIDSYDLGYIYEDPEDLKKFLQNIDQINYEQKSKNCIKYLLENHDHLNLGRKFLTFLNSD
jgi:glycosyltransferase involved in cell wall biosynthesis